MGRVAWIFGAFCALLLAASPALAAPLRLERIVLLQRHGVRPPVSSNEDLAKYAALPWPAWPVPPGELTPHGGEVVKLVATSLRQAYLAKGLLPATGCPAAGAVSVWADGTDQRTRRTGEILGESLAPGCALKPGWAPPAPRDPIFGGSSAPACRIDPALSGAAILAAAGPGGLETPTSRRALLRLQSILAPDACAGGKGMCFKGDNKVDAATGRTVGPLFTASSLAEDLLLEYADGMATSQVGWGKAGSAATIAAVMPVHERSFGLISANTYLVGRAGAPMARVILAALAGAPGKPDGPQFGPASRVVALAGHDTNLALMAGVFGLDWTLPAEPDATAPATALVFELWSDPATGAKYVRPVVYFATLEQMRSLSPATAQRLPLRFNGCASGPMGTCALAEVRRRVEAVLAPGCGEN